MIQTRSASIPALLALAAVIGVAASAVASDGSVDLQLRGKDKVAGTLRPVYDTECYVCDMPRGSVLSVSLKGAGKPVPTIGLALKLEGVDVAGAPIVTSTKGATIRSYAVDASGRYTVCVRGAGFVDGDYAVSVSWRPRSSWQGTGGPLDPAATDVFTFGAPAGASATIDVVPSQGSEFAGSLVSVTGPSGFDAGAVAGTHAVVPVCPTTGDYAVTLRNDGAAAGAWTARVKLKLPRVSKDKIDLRDRALTGAFGADHTVYGRLLDDSGGTVSVENDAFGPLDGTSVTVPPDSLGSPTVITINATTTVYPEDGSHPAGPAVEFGPTGTTFAEDATLTLPYDPAYFPGGTETLEVYVRDADGNVTLVPGPYTIDEVNHLVSFPVSHFSSYQAAATGPRPLTGEFYAVELIHDVFEGFEGKFGFGFHRIFPSGSTAQVSLQNARIAWHDYGVEGSDAVLETSGDFATFDVAIPDDATVQLTNQQNAADTAVFVRGVSDDVLVGKGKAIIALRRAPGYPTVSTAMGRWHLLHLSAGGGSQDNGGTSFGQLSLHGETGDVTLKPDGTVDLSGFRGLDANTGFPSGTWQFSSGDPPPAGLTWGIGDGIVSISEPGDRGSFQLEMALGGDVMLGQPYSFGTQFDGPSTDLFLFVRDSARATLGSLVGDFLVAGEKIVTEDRANPPGQGMTFQDFKLVSTLTGSGLLSGTGTFDVATNDTQGTPVFLAGQPASGAVGRLSLASDGGFTISDGSRGAVTAHGDLLVRVHFQEGSFSMYFATPAPPVTKR